MLLFDEPLSNLDAKLRVEMRGEIQKLQRTLGITTLYVTHDQEEAMAISDRIAVMKDGRIVQLGSASDLYRRPTSTFVARFIGRANILRCATRADAIHSTRKTEGSRNEKEIRAIAPWHLRDHQQRALFVPRGKPQVPNGPIQEARAHLGAIGRQAACHFMGWHGLAHFVAPRRPLHHLRP